MNCQKLQLRCSYRSKIEKAQKKILWALTNINNKTIEYENNRSVEGMELNQRHIGVQPIALPPELPLHETIYKSKFRKSRVP